MKLGIVGENIPVLQKEANSAIHAAMDHWRLPYINKVIERDKPTLVSCFLTIPEKQCFYFAKVNQHNIAKVETKEEVTAQSTHLLFLRRYKDNTEALTEEFYNGIPCFIYWI